MVLNKKSKKSSIKNNSKIAPKRISKLQKSSNPQISGYMQIILFLVLLLIDRITKFWAMNFSKMYDMGFVALRFVTNTGAGFSIFQNQNIMLTWIAIIALGAIIYFHKEFPKSAVILIIAGLIGNLIDRLAYGAVIDFIDLKFWPIFNLSDAYISLGVIITIIFYLHEQYSGKKEINTDNTNISKISKQKNSKKRS